MIDGTIIRAHRHAAGARGGQENQALGRSCGGFSSKIHGKVDALGLPMRFIVTAGQESDIGLGDSLLGNDSCDYLLADRGYDSDPFRAFLVERGISPIIPGRKSKKVTIHYDEHIYKERNAVERFLDVLKNFGELQHVMTKQFVCLKELSCLLRSSCGVNFEDRA